MTRQKKVKNTQILPQFRHLPQCSAIYRPNFTDLQFFWHAKKAKSILNMPVYSPAKAMFVSLSVSETQCVIYRLDFTIHRLVEKS